MCGVGVLLLNTLVHALDVIVYIKNMHMERGGQCLNRFRMVFVVALLFHISGSATHQFDGSALDQC